MTNENLLKIEDYVRNHRNDFLEFLSSIYYSPEYTCWLKNKRKYACEKYLFTQLENSKGYEILKELKLIKNSELEVVIDKSVGRIFITDGNWIDNEIRVHPYKDEAEDIYNYAKKSELYEWADVIIDPACGAGHHCLNYDGGIERYSFDINQRATIYTRINFLISGLKAKKIKTISIDDNNIETNKKKVLICGNMPFGIFPQFKKDMPLSQYGGDDGVQETYKLFKFIEKQKKINNNSNIKSLVLFTTLGNLENNKWEVIEYAANKFGRNKFKYKILKNNNLLRINGIKKEKNPMPIENLIFKSQCDVSFSSDEISSVEEFYLNISNYYLNKNITHMSYGIIELDL